MILIIACSLVTYNVLLGPYLFFQSVSSNDILEFLPGSQSPGKRTPSWKKTSKQTASCFNRKKPGPPNHKLTHKCLRCLSSSHVRRCTGQAFSPWPLNKSRFGAKLGHQRDPRFLFDGFLLFFSLPNNLAKPSNASISSRDAVPNMNLTPLSRNLNSLLIITIT